MEKFKRKFSFISFYSFINILLTQKWVFAASEKTSNSSVFGCISFILFVLGDYGGKNIWGKKGKLIYWMFFFLRCVFIFIAQTAKMNASIICDIIFLIIIIIIMVVTEKKVKSKKTNTTTTIPKSNTSTINQIQENKEENTSKDTSPVVLIDPMYLNDEKSLLKNMIEGEIESQGEDPKKLSTSNLNIKRNILLSIFTMLTFLFTMMYFFNISLGICLLCECIAILTYIMIGKKFNIINVISKQAKNNPNEDIANIVANTKNNKKDIIVPNMMKLSISVIVAILIPIAIFVNPRMIYVRYGEGYALFKYTKGLNKQNTEIVIPDTYKGRDVIAISANAFSKTNIKSIKLPKNLQSIKYRAFYGCTLLTSIIVPKNVEEIRESAFEECSNLMTVSLSNGITDIRAKAFKNDKNLSNIELPDSLEYLGASAFSHCSSLNQIRIPDKVVEINGQTFEYCTALRRIYLHDNIISIHGENFVGDIMLDDVVLPSKITEIRGNTFEGCTSLKSINIPNGVTRIGGHAFYGCSSLSNVNIPASVVEIGSSAFRRCTSLRKVKVSRYAVINERAFKESPTTISYY